MSISLMTMARKTALSTNSKFALMALADWADDNGSNCYPSVYELSEYLTCSERTVQRLLRELEVDGWIAVIGHANGGATSRRYCLNVPRMAAESQAESERREIEKERRRRERKSSDSNPFLEGCQSVTPDNLSPVTTTTSGVTNQAQGVTGEVKRGDTAVTPSTIDPPIDPPIKKNAPTRKAKGSTDCLNKPEDVTDQTWSDWLQLRKSKRSPVTHTVLDGARAEALKAGLSLEAFLQVWCVRGSQGLMAEWLKPSERQSGARPLASNHKFAAAAATIYEA